jgi:hypothetical protein
MATALTPLRTQYMYDLSGVKYRSRADLLNLQRQWETFERVENYNDIVYQQISAGNRGTLYYQFRTRQEYMDYKNGQELHVLRYPALAKAGAFSSISERAMPDVPVLVKAPTYSMSTDRGILFSTSIMESQRMENQSDLAVYTYVSTYNSEHVFKYNFPSNEEKIAYHRAERLLRMNGMV